MTSGRRVVPGLALFAASLLLPAPAAVPARAQDAPPAGPSAPAKPSAEDTPGLAALRKELEDVYLAIQKDFEALTGPKAAETVAALEAAVAEEAKTRKGGTVDVPEFAALWTSKSLLGPITATRLAARIREATAKAAEGKAGDATTLGDSLRIAIRLVFPESSMDANWDKHFMDLDVVQRWAKMKGASPAPPDPVRAPAVPDPADMILVPKGDLAVPDQRGRGWPHLGQKAEKRSLKPYYIDRTEVTGAAYADFLRETKDAKLRDRCLPQGWKADDKGMPLVPEGAAGLPVTGVPYEGAAAFAVAHGKRLPTEDEWERAARGNQGWKYPWGADWVDGNAVAGGKAGPAEAGSTPGDRSPFGVMDMAGNVSELCATYPDGKSVKGVPKATEQVVIRGGNFKDAAEETANDWRYVVGPTARSETVGFRCAMDEADYKRRYGKK
jgi:formylglycine-generating enzyme required for sulfatase activity